MLVKFCVCDDFNLPVAHAKTQPVYRTVLNLYLLLEWVARWEYVKLHGWISEL